MRNLGHWVVRCRVAILWVAGIGFIVATVIGAQTPGRLSSSGYEPTNAESVRAAAAMRELFPANTVDLAIVVRARRGTVDSADVTASGTALTKRIAAEPGVERAASYWTLGKLANFRGRDDRFALVVAALGSNTETNEHTTARIVDRYRGRQGPIDVAIGGQVESIRELAGYSKQDSTRAELYVMPLVVLILLLVFGSVVASLLPLIAAAIATVGTLVTLWVLTLFTDASIFGMSIATILALGLAIDYSLLAVSRFREELASSDDPLGAAQRTVETAGRTIFFSGLTVSLAFGALAVMPMQMFRSIAVAGAACAAFAVLGAVVVLPALLAVLGPRVNAGVIWKRSLRPRDRGFWYRSAKRVMRRPIATIVVVCGILLVLGAPFLRLQGGVSDDRQLPPSAPARAAQDLIRQSFDGDEIRALSVVATHTGNPSTRTADVEQYALRLSRLHGVANVSTLTGTYAQGRRSSGPDVTSTRYGAKDAVWFRVVPNVEPVSGEGASLVKTIRAGGGPFHVEVAGFSGRFVDIRDAIDEALPRLVAILALSMFVLLFLMSGSLLVPLKAIVLNILSLSATFGAMVWIFQDGHFSGALDFTRLDTLDLQIPVYVLAVAFGLSMDYEVFLLSRIKEEYECSGDNEESVAVGLQHTGRVVTACAVLMAVVMMGLSMTRVTSSKLLGVGVAIAVVVDAFIIRGTLIPAFMKLAGRWNWWAPRPLRRLHDRFGLRESADRATTVAPAPVLVGDRAERSSRSG
ncbi:MAG: MMPL family transporter [Acidimicrobiia bacterium]